MALLTGWFGRPSKPTKWIKKKTLSCVWLVLRVGPLKDEKKLLLEKENLDSLLKSVSTWSPVSALNLKMCILKMRIPQAKMFWVFEILHLKISKWTENELTYPYEIQTLPHRGTPLTLTGGTHYVYCGPLLINTAQHPITLKAGCGTLISAIICNYPGILQ